jgi:hypothetical protein
MSGTSTQSLASIIDSNASGTTQASAPAMTIPSLQNAIDSTSSASGSVVAPQPVGTTSAPAVDSAPAAGATPSYTPVTETSQQQQQAILRQLLTQRGFNIPSEFSNDDQIADLIAAQLDSASTIESSPEFQQFKAWQAQQGQSNAAGTPAPAVQSNPAPTAKTEEIPESKILSAITDGYVTFDAAARKWVPTYAQFASHADAINSRAEKTQQTKINLATDPQDFIRQQIQDAVNTLKPQSEVNELKQILEEIKQERVNAQWAQVDSWIDQNRPKLFSADNKPTPYGNLYVQFESAITSADPSFANRPLERHNEVLKRIAIAEQAFRPAQQASPQQGQANPAAPAQRPSFLDGAARRNGTNRLSEYTGPANNAVPPQVPLGPGGLPSLNGIINQMTSLTSN